MDKDKAIEAVLELVNIYKEEYEGVSWFDKDYQKFTDAFEYIKNNLK